MIKLTVCLGSARCEVTWLGYDGKVLSVRATQVKDKELLSFTIDERAFEVMFCANNEMVDDVLGWLKVRP